ncbi:MAG: archease [Thermoplasmata archaeon]|nr:MAG: archease [Thermoplasmata archaeon]
MSEESRRYDLVEVTADVAIRARGGSLGQLYANAAWGMFDLICDSATVEDYRTWEVEVASQDLEGLMVDLLTDMLVLFETDGMLVSSVDVDVDQSEGEWHAVARVRGEPLDRERHQLLHDIKAVTYHTLEVRPDEGWARVLFDI